MKLFDRTGGYYLFWCSAVYLTAGLTSIYLQLGVSSQIQVAWIFAISAPFWCPPWGRWLNMDITWDQKMFEKWFGKKDETPSNVVKFPEPKAVPPMPQVEPPKQEEPAKIYYRLGLTDNNRVAFSMGYSEITMNAQGVQNMIDQLEFFKSQIQDEEYNADAT